MIDGLARRRRLTHRLDARAQLVGRRRVVAQIRIVHRLERHIVLCRERRVDARLVAADREINRRRRRRRALHQHAVGRKGRPVRRAGEARHGRRFAPPEMEFIACSSRWRAMSSLPARKSSIACNRSISADERPAAFALAAATGVCATLGAVGAAV